MRSSHHQQFEYPLTFSVHQKSDIYGATRKGMLCAVISIYCRVLHRPRSPDDHNEAQICIIVHKILVMHGSFYLLDNSVKHFCVQNRSAILDPIAE